MPEIIVKNYEHLNTSFSKWDTPKGKYIKNKDHYNRTMKEQGMVPEDKVKLKSNIKEYKLSDKAREIIRTAKNSADKKGNVKLSDRTIDALKSIGNRPR